LVTPFTVQVTAVLDVLATAAVIAKVPFTTTLCVKLVGLVMETATAGGGVIVTLTEADLVVSATLVAVTLNVAGDGTAAGASYVTDKPEPEMVPYVALPLVTPFTVQVTPVLAVPVTDAVMPKVALTAKLCAPVGVVMETTTPGKIVTLTEADLVLSATLVAETLNVAGDGTAAGAV
jgi:hypothetical protein